MRRANRWLYRRMLGIWPSSVARTHAREMEEGFLALLELEIEGRGWAGYPVAWFYAVRDLARWGRSDQPPLPSMDRGPRSGRQERLGTLLADLRFAVRQLVRNPGFAFVAVITLALGIGANTAIFSLVDAVVFQPLPFDEPGRIVSVWSFRDQRGSASSGNFTEWHRRQRSFDALAAATYQSYNWADAESAERLLGRRVTVEFFEVFAASPVIGRGFTADEDRAGGPSVVVLSHRLWRDRFASDRSVLGRAMTLNGEPYTIVGVMSPAFDLTHPEALWVPMAFTPFQLSFFDEHRYRVVGRLAAGVTLEAAGEDMHRVAEALQSVAPRDNVDLDAQVTSYTDDFVGGVRARYLILLGAVGVVLLIACGNVANLLLARATGREREIATRLALGASRRRVARQLLTESLLLAAVAGVVGVAVSAWSVGVLVSFSPPNVPRVEQAGVDLRVLSFALGATVLSGVLFGLWPALAATGPRAHAALRDGRHGTSDGGGRTRVRQTLIAAEVALTMVLLVGAGLLIRSAVLLTRVDPGFDPHSVLTARLALPEAGYPNQETMARGFAAVADEVRRLPGVEEAAMVTFTPFLGGWGSSNGLLPQGLPLAPENMITGNYRLVTPGYFATMGLRLVRGRLFGESDGVAAPRVMIVNETLARLAFGDDDPIGKTIACCEDDEAVLWKTVVGVVADAQMATPGGAINPEFFLPIWQVPNGGFAWIANAMTLVVRTAGEPRSMAPALREAVRRVDPGVPVYDVQTVEDRLAVFLARDRFNRLLLTTLGGAALLLAAVGIYGVIAYAMGCRRRELGVRIALGAGPTAVLRLVVSYGLRPVLAGSALGVLGAGVATRALSGMVFGVGLLDPLTIGSVLTLLCAVAGTACLIPAYRVMRLDPASTLRSE